MNDTKRTDTWEEIEAAASEMRPVVLTTAASAILDTGPQAVRELFDALETCAWLRDADQLTVFEWINKEMLRRLSSAPAPTQGSC